MQLTYINTKESALCLGSDRNECKCFKVIDSPDIALSNTMPKYVTRACCLISISQYVTSSLPTFLRIYLALSLPKWLLS